MPHSNPPKPKLLFVVEAMGGGVFTYTVNLCNALTRWYDICLAYAVRPQTPVDYLEYFDPAIHLVKVKDFTRPISPKKDIKAFMELKKIAKDFKPDVIHLHSSKAGVLGRIAFAFGKTPLFYTPHGYSFLMQGVGGKTKAMYYTIEWMLAKLPCTTISCSVGEHQQTLTLTHRAALVNNGIDTRELDEILASSQDTQPLVPLKESILKGKNAPCVYTLGRICVQKNPQLFQQMAQLLPEFDFLWIGDGELREVLSAPNITITGWTNRQQALALAQKANYFVLPSLWEGLPISLLESMYLRKPCLVSNVIGNRDVVEHGKNGFIGDTAEQFAQSVRVLSNPHLCQSICDTAFQDVMEHYTVETMAAGYHEIYNKAMGAMQVKEHTYPM